MNINNSTSMFYGASSKIFEHAKILRQNMTNSEMKLWESLKGKKILGLRFRRQHPISTYIADFYCHQLKLVIEVDGGIHKMKEQKVYDIGREIELYELGVKVIRFRNDEVENQLEKVLKVIEQTSLVRKTEIQSPL